MRYASIRKMDISNGEGIGVSLFVQGCRFHCRNCFNSDTWNFSGGHLWNDKVRDYIIELADKPYITRLSILGGEPLADENVYEVHDLIWRFKSRYPEKKIWLYTGYTWEDVVFGYCSTECSLAKVAVAGWQHLAVTRSDILVDGQYIDKLKDPKLKWRGSSNQRVIDVEGSLEAAPEEKVILYE